MPQSLSNVILHIVFATKYREPRLVKPVRHTLFACMATIVRNAGSECYRAGGVENHVHLSVRLNRTETIADLVEGVKGGSSRWLKTQETGFRDFSWQRGYAAFSVSYRHLDGLNRYIEDQEAHHSQPTFGQRVLTFEEEYRRFLRDHGVAFDERYLWD